MTWATKQFVLMGGQKYYACGGFEDFLGSFDTREEAEVAEKAWREAEGHDYIWTQIADLSTGDYTSKGRAEASIARFLK